MKKIYTLLLSVLFTFPVLAQSTITGTLLEGKDLAIGFANVALYDTTTKVLAKVEVSDDKGQFSFAGIDDGIYYLDATFIGYDDLRVEEVVVKGQDIDLGNLMMKSSSVQLDAAVVVAKRNMVEVKADRTVFNVEGTINSAGDNAIGLLRKAPGVLVDNNNNITVLSRAGVLVYVDGKRLPLGGADLTAYLEGLQADQIDRMDIITNPGAKYEAEGNAGIIDIRLKRQKGYGYNGSISSNVSQGQYARGNLSLQGNYRNKLVNVFGTAGVSKDRNFNEMAFLNFQNGFFLDEKNRSVSDADRLNLRLGTDFYLNDNSTVGFLVSTQGADQSSVSDNFVKQSAIDNQTKIDSVLFADNTTNGSNRQSTYNLNYVYDNKKSTINVDLDYGSFVKDNEANQPNRYYLTESRSTLLSENLTFYETPNEIDIYAGKIDYQTDLGKGKFGAGAKYSKVVTDNTFLFFNVQEGQNVQNNGRSNRFVYDEGVSAGYVNYNTSLTDRVTFSGGLRVEHTDATGDLETFDASIPSESVDFDYVSYFPSGGLAYQVKMGNTVSLNYGRRINRPDYNVLNPFREQLSELSFSKGNAFLRPEIVNNIELGYTLNWRYNFKVSYSRTTDQITRLIGPDDEDPRAGFISWANLAVQNLYNFTASLPHQVTPWWNTFLNATAGYVDNQADYGEGGIVDVQAFTYNFFNQNTFTLGKGYTGEISGWFSGPGVWGGVFKYDPSYSLNLGIQKKFLNNRLNVKLAVNDIFFQSGWSGESSFNGLVGQGRGNWDSRRAALSLSYNFGYSDVKSRKRKTGLEEEKGRVGG